MHNCFLTKALETKCSASPPTRPKKYIEMARCSVTGPSKSKNIQLLLLNSPIGFTLDSPP